MNFRRITVSLFLTCLLLVITFFSLNPSITVLASGENREDVLEYWAPQVFQDLRQDKVLWHQYYPAGDMITNVNYDDDWDAGNNWDNTPRSGDFSMMKAYAYGIFIETETHYFLTYCYYHSMDDAFFSADRHENDVENVNLVIRKGTENDGYGTFEVMETTIHSTKGEYTSNDVIFNTTNGCHPKVFISSNGDVLNNQFDFNAKGHAIFAFDPNFHTTDTVIGNDAIIYNVGDVAEAPTDISGKFTNSYTYQVLMIDEIWDRRYNIGDYDTFESYGTLNGRDQSVGGNFPWGSLNDPVSYYNNKYNLTQNGPVSSTYLYNPYN
ncbi:hypothetical protein [Vallitalea okinawensis]|uniref:hypothetical protein n=1 Tax=Vallitalea okinawensis TaxID=2078660 RepID=UPI000CFC7DD7|nr:hypothetical protein [Vallitalea okinawensis]